MKFPETVKSTVDILSDVEAVPVHCRVTEKGLYPALSPVKLSTLTLAGVTYACHSEAAERFFLCTDSYSYVSGNGQLFSLLDELVGDAPFLVEEISEGESYALVINGAYAVKHTGSSFKVFAYGADLSCGAMHCGRLFGADSADGTILRWSGEGGACDWAEGLHGSGSVRLDPKRGDVLDMTELGEKLVLVRKFGLTLVSAYGAPENYKVEITDTDTDGVVGRTARVVCGKLLFYTASGLQCYDNATVSEVKHRLSRDVSAPTYALEYGGKYYLSCTSKALGGRAILCYDPADGESYLIDCAADGMCCSEVVYVYDTSVNHGVFTLGEGGEYSYTCVLDFGTSRKKTVTEIFADCDGVDIEISNGRISRTFQDVCGTVRPRMRGRKFTVTVRGNCRIKKLTATAEVSVGI